MTTLVTGGAGYIGSHVVRALRESGAGVVVLDSLATGHRRAVAPEVPFVHGDIRDGDVVADVLRRYDVGAVIHLAAAKSVSSSMVAPGPTFANNVTGTLTLLEAMTGAGVGRLVFSSTCAVYGTPDALPIDETAAIAPDNPYGESKAIAERMISWYGRLTGLTSVVLRYFNAAGADAGGDLGESWEQAENLVPAVLRAAWTGLPVPVFGRDYPTPDGTAVRDYVHVVDLARAHLRALEHLADGGPSLTLNLGTGSGSSVLDVLETARSIVHRPIGVVDAPRRPGDPAAVWSDPGRADRELGWKAKLDLRSMLESAWAWHTSHPSGHDPAPDDDPHGRAGQLTIGRVR